MPVHRAVTVNGRVGNRCGFQVGLPRCLLELAQSNRPHQCARVVVKRVDGSKPFAKNSLRLFLALAIGQGLSLMPPAFRAVRVADEITNRPFAVLHLYRATLKATLHIAFLLWPALCFRSA